MCGEDIELIAALEEALEGIVEEEPLMIATIRAIVFNNLVICRVNNFLDNGTVSNPKEYVLRVADHYKEWHLYIRRLQVEQNHQLWIELLDTLEKWARGFLKRLNFPPGRDRDQAARDCAADAGSILANKRFPFDVHFDSWASTVLRYVCLRHVEMLWNKNKPQQNESTADIDHQMRSTIDPEVTDSFRQFERRFDLLNAIEQMASEARKQFILLYYFEQKSFDEIAIIMGKSKNTLYKLHYDSLDDLGKILGEKRDKDE